MSEHGTTKVTCISATKKNEQIIPPDWNSHSLVVDGLRHGLSTTMLTNVISAVRGGRAKSLIMSMVSPNVTSMVKVEYKWSNTNGNNKIIVTMQDICASTHAGDQKQRDDIQFDLTKMLKDAQLKKFDKNLLKNMHTASNVVEASREFVNSTTLGVNPRGKQIRPDHGSTMMLEYMATFKHSFSQYLAIYVAQGTTTCDRTGKGGRNADITSLILYFQQHGGKAIGSKLDRTHSSTSSSNSSSSSSSTSSSNSLSTSLSNSLSTSSSSTTKITRTLQRLEKITLTIGVGTGAGGKYQFTLQSYERGSEKLCEIDGCQNINFLDRLTITSPLPPRLIVPLKTSFKANSNANSKSNSVSTNSFFKQRSTNRIFGNRLDFSTNRFKLKRKQPPPPPQQQQQQQQSRKSNQLVQLPKKQVSFKLPQKKQDQSHQLPLPFQPPPSSQQPSNAPVAKVVSQPQSDSTEHEVVDLVTPTKSVGNSNKKPRFTAPPPAEVPNNSTATTSSSSSSASSASSSNKLPQPPLPMVPMPAGTPGNGPPMSMHMIQMNSQRMIQQQHQMIQQLMQMQQHQMPVPPVQQVQQVQQVTADSSVVVASSKFPDLPPIVQGVRIADHANTFNGGGRFDTYKDAISKIAKSWPGGEKYICCCNPTLTRTKSGFTSHIVGKNAYHGCRAMWSFVRAADKTEADQELMLFVQKYSK